MGNKGSLGGSGGGGQHKGPRSRVLAVGDQGSLGKMGELREVAFGAPLKTAAPEQKLRIAAGTSRRLSQHHPLGDPSKPVWIPMAALSGPCIAGASL